MLSIQSIIPSCTDTCKPMAKGGELGTSRSVPETRQTGSRDSPQSCISLLYLQEGRNPLGCACLNVSRGMTVPPEPNVRYQPPCEPVRYRCRDEREQAETVCAWHKRRSSQSACSVVYTGLAPHRVGSVFSIVGLASEVFRTGGSSQASTCAWRERCKNGRRCVSRIPVSRGFRYQSSPTGLVVCAAGDRGQ